MERVGGYCMKKKLWDREMNWYIVYNTHGTWEENRVARKFVNEEDAMECYRDLKKHERKNILDEIEIIPDKRAVILEFLNENCPITSDGYYMVFIEKKQLEV